MEKLDFEELVIIASSLDVNYEALICEKESQRADTSSSAYKYSEQNWDTMHTLMIILDELYTLRPLPF